MVGGSGPARDTKSQAERRGVERRGLAADAVRRGQGVHDDIEGLLREQKELSGQYSQICGLLLDTALLLARLLVTRGPCDTDETFPSPFRHPRP